ncbi:MAG TPA: prolipoprotein diacylglyceryl transferase family protein [Thermoanaerobaculia bacterium]|nr:prolipoprotein diacylglyceryl transferase family protein [Thermoanaerobaculia bacterium]
MVPRSRFLAPYLHFGTRKLSSFTFCGIVGVIAAVVLAMTLTAHRALSLWMMAAIVVAAIATFFAVILVTKVITGVEQIIYYHHEIAVLVAAAFVAKLFGAPVLAYLDFTILGIGAFLFCGRIGCLLVGCCHGRPSRFGVRYGDEHVACGFTWYYAGVRIFPLQLVEAVWVLGVVIVASMDVWRGAPPGAALAAYVIAYDFARFVLEYFRGDPARPYTFGLSQAQWISFWLTATVVIGELRGVLPWRVWHLATLLVLIAAMIVTILLRRRSIAHVHHVREVANIVARDPQVHQTDAPVTVARTSGGLCLSASRVIEATGPVSVFAFSSPSAPMSEREAAAMVRLILLLRRVTAPARVLRRERGVFELVVRE